MIWHDHIADAGKMVMDGARNGRGTNRETANRAGFGVLTRSRGFVRNGGKLPQRPDGGVVTQRTANPLTRPRFRQSLHNSPSVPRIAFQGLSAPTANSAKAIETRSAETVQHGSARRVRARSQSDLPERNGRHG
jgi:hypothetical protein